MKTVASEVPAAAHGDVEAQFEEMEAMTGVEGVSVPEKTSPWLPEPPERVSECVDAGLESPPAEDAWRDLPEGGAAASASSTAQYAGLTREIETVLFGRPGMAILKLRWFRFTTRNGPMYGEEREA